MSEVVHTSPTIGSNVEEVRLGDELIIPVVDVKYNELHYLKTCDSKHSYQTLFLPNISC